MTVRTTSALTTAQTSAVLDLVAAATDADGVAPLSEQSMLAVRHGTARTHLLTADGTDGAGPDLDGYALLDGSSAELVVAPGARRRGIGTALARTLLGAAPPDVAVWAHGDRPAAAALAERLGLHRTRVLYQLRRPLDADIAPAALPEGVRIRPFVVGQDEAEWLGVNTRAFAHHPEQGSWTMRDVTDREAEPWFDAAGVLLAVRTDDDSLLGFHWTKVHPAEELHEAEPVGEVYVVGVDPQRGAGLHLGTALTLAGLHHLRAAGLGSVLLYVDEDNPRAVSMYRRLGFTQHTVDVTYALPRA